MSSVVDGVVGFELRVGGSSGAVSRKTVCRVAARGRCVGRSYSDGSGKELLGSWERDLARGLL